VSTPLLVCTFHVSILSVVAWRVKVLAGTSCDSPGVAGTRHETHCAAHVERRLTYVTIESRRMMDVYSDDITQLTSRRVNARRPSLRPRLVATDAYPCPSVTRLLELIN